MLKRVTAILCCVCMLFVMLPVGTAAADAEYVYEVTAVTQNGKETVAPGETITYEFVVKNSGKFSGLGVNVVFSDAVEIVSVSAPQVGSLFANCTDIGQQVTYGGISMANISSMTDTVLFTVEAKVSETAAIGSVVSAVLTVEEVCYTDENYEPIDIAAGNIEAIDAPSYTVYAYYPVTGITADIPTDAYVGEAIDLSAAAVTPANATNKTIIWSVEGDCAAITDNKLIASAAGSVTLKATIKNGAAEDSDFVKTYDIAFTVKPCDCDTLKHIERKASTCDTAGHIEYWECEECGTYYVDAEGETKITDKASTALPLREHSWKTEYSHDSTNHWYDCAYEDCDAKNGTAAHECTQKHDVDSHWDECACGYIDAASKTAHSYTNADKDGTHHWNACVCGAAGTKTAHDYTASYQYVDDNNHRGVCACGAENPETEAHSGGTPTCLNKAVCEKCDEPYSGIAAHNLTTEPQSAESPASCETDGTKAVWVCQTPGCGKEFIEADGEKIEATAKNKVISKLNHAPASEWSNVQEGDSWYHYHVCGNNCGKKLDYTACDHKAKYNETQHWSECETCGHKLNETAHNMLVKHDDTNHWTACDGCDYTTVKSAHTVGTTATCQKKAVCGDCGNEYGTTAAHSYEGQPIVNTDAAGHYQLCVYGCGTKTNVTAHTAEWTIENGQHWKQCECGYYIVEAAAHSLKHTAAKGAECEVDGNYDYYTCTVCEKVFKDAEGTQLTTVAEMTIAKLNHKYTGALVSTDPAGHYKLCDNGCGTKSEEAVHFANWTTDGGEHYKKCACGYDIVASEAHTVKHIGAKAAECEAAGNYEYWYCEVCGSYSLTEDWTRIVNKSATVIAALKHNLITINAKEATSDDEGYTGDSWCTICKTIVRYGEVIPKKSSFLIPQMVSVDFITGADMKFDGRNLMAGSTIDLDQYLPEREGYVFDGWYADEALTMKLEGQVKVDESLELYASWLVIPDFTDVPADAAYFDDVMYVFNKGLMIGVSDTEFEPDETGNRAMMATVLHRLYLGAEAAAADEGVSMYEDVPENEWYTAAVSWATENGIYKGYEDGTFRPMQAITHQELVTIFYRYAGMIGAELEESEPDAKLAGVADWAADAMEWAVGTGLFTAEEAMIAAPNADAARWEIAAMIHRFLEAIA